MPELEFVPENALTVETTDFGAIVPKHPRKKIGIIRYKYLIKLFRNILS